MVLVVQVLAYPKRYVVSTDLIRALYIIFLIKDLLNYQSAFSIVTGRLGTNGGSLPYRIKFEDGAQVRSKRKVQRRDFGGTPPHNSKDHHVQTKQEFHINVKEFVPL